MEEKTIIEKSVEELEKELTEEIKQCSNYYPVEIGITKDIEKE